MVHFFGILSPAPGPRIASADAPFKTGFFGGTPLAAPLPISRAERDALYLAGKCPHEAVETEADVEPAGMAEPGRA